MTVVLISTQKNYKIYTKKYINLLQIHQKILAVTDRITVLSDRPMVMSDLVSQTLLPSVFLHTHPTSCSRPVARKVTNNIYL